MNRNRAAHAGLQVSALQTGKSHDSGAREFPHQLAALARRQARHIGTGMLHVGHHLHHGSVLAQRLRFAQNHFMAQVSLVMEHEADGLTLADFDAVGCELRGASFYYSYIYLIFGIPSIYQTKIYCNEFPV